MTSHHPRHLSSTASHAAERRYQSLFYKKLKKLINTSIYQKKFFEHCQNITILLCLQIEMGSAFPSLQQIYPECKMRHKEKRKIIK